MPNKWQTYCSFYYPPILAFCLLCGCDIMSELLSLGDVTKQHLTALFFLKFSPFIFILIYPFRPSPAPLLLHYPWHPPIPTERPPPCLPSVLSVFPAASILRLSVPHCDWGVVEIWGRQMWVNVASEEGGIIQVTLVWRERARIASSLLLRLPPPSLDFSLSLSLWACVLVCVPPASPGSAVVLPQMSWREEEKRMDLAKGKQEEFGPACKTN